MGGAGRSGAGLRMVGRVIVGGAGLCRVCLYGGGRVLGLLCVEGNGGGSNLAVHFNFFPIEFFLSVGSSHLR